VDLPALKEYVSRGGANSMSDDEMQALFESLKLQKDDMITEDQFLNVFSMATGQLKDAEFRLLLAELLS